MDVSIIIVNYSTCKIIQNCLKSIYEQTEGVDFEVIVSDNGSKDGSIEMLKQEFPQVILIENKANIGFGAANNRGLKIAKGKYIFYLNSDTILLNNAIKLFYEYWENSPDKDKIGALGTNMTDGNGKLTTSYVCFPKPWQEILNFSKRIIKTNAKYIMELIHFKYKSKKKSKINTTTYKIGEVDSVSGADLFLKNNELAYFDERFFLYYEETNLEWNLNKKQLLRLLIEGPEIVHLHGKSNPDSPGGVLDNYVSFGVIQSDLSRIRYIKYNISSFYAWILKVLLAYFWLLPIYYKKTKQYRKEIWKI